MKKSQWAHIVNPKVMLEKQLDNKALFHIFFTNANKKYEQPLRNQTKCVKIGAYIGFS